MENYFSIFKIEIPTELKTLYEEISDEFETSMNEFLNQEQENLNE